MLMAYASNVWRNSQLIRAIFNEKSQLNLSVPNRYKQHLNSTVYNYMPKIFHFSGRIPIMNTSKVIVSFSIYTQKQIETPSF